MIIHKPKYSRTTLKWDFQGPLSKKWQTTYMQSKIMREIIIIYNIYLKTVLFNITLLDWSFPGFVLAFGMHIFLLQSFSMKALGVGLTTKIKTETEIMWPPDTGHKGFKTSMKYNSTNPFCLTLSSTQDAIHMVLGDQKKNGNACTSFWLVADLCPSFSGCNAGRLFSSVFK